MNNTEELLKAAFAATAEPQDAGFARGVVMRIDAVARRRRVLLVLAMIIGAMLLATMFAGLFWLEPLWAQLAQHSWFTPPPGALTLVAWWAEIVGLTTVAAIAVPVVRSRT